MEDKVGMRNVGIVYAAVCPECICWIYPDEYNENRQTAECSGCGSIIDIKDLDTEAVLGVIPVCDCGCHDD